MTAQGSKFIALSETVYETVTKLKARVNDPNNSSQTSISMLSQLEADMNSSEVIIQDHGFRIMELESNWTADRASILRLTMEIANLEANLASLSTVIKTQGEILISMNETLIQVGTVSNQSNTSSLADMKKQLIQLKTELENRLLQIETDMKANLENIKVDYSNITDKIKLLETNVMSEMGKSKNLTSNLADLEFEIGTIKATVQNNQVGIIDINDKIRLLNDTFTDDLGMAPYLSSNITYLELEIGTMKAEIQNNTRGFVSSAMYLQELDKSTNDSISRLGNGLTNITGNNFAHYIDILNNKSQYTSKNDPVQPYYLHLFNHKGDR